jgi:GMP synthase-like glutamine amidotransferase
VKIAYLQHVPFEDPAHILSWAKKRNHFVQGFRLYKNEDLSDMHSSYDMLVVMGGPMGVSEEEKYPWLSAEKKLIAGAIQNHKIVLGVCLGTQLIASVLGARIDKNRFKEIGWFPVWLTEKARNHSIFQEIPASFSPFHWHGDTFDIPEGAIRIAESQACTNQGFLYGDRIIGLQFHLESTRDSIRKLIQNCGSELIEGDYIQSESLILEQSLKHIDSINNHMNTILDNLVTSCSED